MKRRVSVSLVVTSLLLGSAIAILRAVANHRNRVVAHRSFGPGKPNPRGSPAGSVGSQMASEGRTPSPKLQAPTLEPRTLSTEARISELPSAQFLDVSILQGTEHKTLVNVSTTRSAPYHAFRLDNPSRVVVDVQPARMPGAPKTYEGHSPLVKDVRVAQFQREPSVVRVVADLSGDASFAVQAQPGGLRVELEPGGLAALASAQRSNSPADEASDRGPHGRKTDSGVLTLDSGLRTERLHADLSSLWASQPMSPAITPAPSQARHIEEPVVPLYRTSGQLSAQARAVQAAETVSHASQATPVPPEISTSLQANPQAGQSAPQTAPQFTAVNPAVPAGQEANPSLVTAQQQPKYTGEPISLNLKDVDLKDFFRLIHEISGLNVLVDPDVTGTLTIVLDDTPWDQALDIVLRNYGLAKVVEGSLVRIAKQQTLTAEQQSTARLADAQVEASPLVTIFRRLKYAHALDLPSQSIGSPPVPGVVTILKGLVGAGGLTKRGTVVADSRNNSLIITDVTPQIPIIDSLIEKLDKKSPQVSIETRIVLATSDFMRTLQSALNYANRNPSHSVVTGGSTGTGASAQGNIITNPPPSDRITLGQTNATGFGAISISNLSSRYFLSAALAAAESRQQAKVISAPAIVTQNNVLGQVIQGVQIPVQTTINNTISTIYINAALQLDVTPQVTDDGGVFLNIKVTNASPGALVGQNPEINTQSATTQVIVPDGGTVVFGGVKVTNRNRSVTQVPVLGSIPLLGNLFKSSTVSDMDQELVFFVTPKILPG